MPSFWQAELLVGRHLAGMDSAPHVGLGFDTPGPGEDFGHPIARRTGVLPPRI
jgi:hypothetical protein